MKTQTKTMMLKVILMVCLIGGCSKTGQMTTQNNLELRNDEPFMETIRELATEREQRIYFPGTIGPEEYERRLTDIVKRRDGAYPISGFEGQSGIVPIFIVRF